MNQNTLTDLGGRIDEVKDLVSYLILSVKEYLVLLVQPVEGKVSDSNLFPHVLDLASSAVDDVSDFVCHYEFKVLRRKLVSNEQAILDLDSSHEVILSI